MALQASRRLASFLLAISVLCNLVIRPWAVRTGEEPACLAHLPGPREQKHFALNAQDEDVERQSAHAVRQHAHQQHPPLVRELLWVELRQQRQQAPAVGQVCQAES